LSERLIPKQIRLTQSQNLLLKRLAKERGVSESEVTRQALQRDESAASYPVRAGEAAWNEILHYVNERKAE
jgi:hypothetical protein